MKVIACLFISMLSVSVYADFDVYGTYTGKINSVAVGHWGSVGVGLPAGVKCNDRQEVILLESNKYFKEILSVLLAAEASGKPVTFYRLTSQNHEFAPNYTYCTITGAALGDYPTW